MCAYASEGCLSSQNWQSSLLEDLSHVTLTFCVTLFFWFCHFPDTAELEGAERQEAVAELRSPSQALMRTQKGILGPGRRTGSPACLQVSLHFSVILDFNHLWAEARGEAVRRQIRAPGSKMKSLHKLLDGGKSLGTWHSTVPHEDESPVSAFNPNLHPCACIPLSCLLGEGKNLDIISYFHTEWEEWRTSFLDCRLDVVIKVFENMHIYTQYTHIHTNIQKTYKHTHTSTNILKCMHTCFTVYVYKASIDVVGCKVLHDGSCVEGLGLRWAIEKWLDRKVVNHPWLALWWWNGLLDLAGESRSILRALGAYLASVLSLCVFVSAFPFPSAVRWASLSSLMLCTAFCFIPNSAAKWPWTNTCETMSPNQALFACVVNLRYFNTWVGADTYLST